MFYRWSHGTAVLVLAMAALPGCSGQTNDQSMDEVGGTGGSVASGGGSLGGGGSTGGSLGTGGDQATAAGGANLGGAETGGDTSSGGSSGGGTGEIGVDPEDAFVTLWETDAGGEWGDLSGGSSDAQSIDLPLLGEVDVVVDWGDGTTSRLTGYYGLPDGVEDGDEHHYAEPGAYVVTFWGTFEYWRFYPFTEDGQDYYSDAPKLREVMHWGAFPLGQHGEMFYHSSRLLVTAADAPNLASPSTLGFTFADASSLTDLSSAAWDVSHVTDMTATFESAVNFNGDLSAWDTSSVTDMSSMFRWASSFDGDLSAWDTSSVTDMSGMFSHAESFNADLSSWDTSSVTDMTLMFSSLSSFNGDLSAWDISNVTDLSGMFYYAESFNADISDWDTSSVTNMGGMFTGAATFDQDLSDWDIGALENALNMLDDSGLSSAHYDALLIGWAAQPTQSGVALGALGIQYSAAAASARAVLTNDRGWTITDGGLAP